MKNETMDCQPVKVDLEDDETRVFNFGIHGASNIFNIDLNIEIDNELYSELKELSAILLAD
jgi:hypothetical protein